MKALLYTLLLVFLFSACKKTVDSPRDIKKDITGSWEIVRYENDPQNTPVLDGTIMVLNADNTFAYKIFFDRTVLTGTYELGKKIECSSNKEADIIKLHYDTGDGEAFINLQNGELRTTTSDCSSTNLMTSVYHRY